MKAIKGRQGDWHVTTRTGERLPCLKLHHRGVGSTYRDAGNYDPTKARTAEYIANIQAGRVILAKYEALPGKPDKRVGYIEHAIFHVTDVKLDADGTLSCRFAGSERL
jgi:hypothetical protein